MKKIKRKSALDDAASDIVDDVLKGAITTLVKEERDKKIKEASEGLVDSVIAECIKEVTEEDQKRP